MQRLLLGAGRLYSAYIPRKDDKYGSDGNFANEALEALFRFSVGVLECLVANLKQVFGTLYCRCNFLAGICDRATHLDGQFLCELSFMAGKLLEEFLDDLLSLLESRLAEALERLGGDLGHQVEVGGGGSIAGDDGLVGIRGDGVDDFDRHFGSWVLLAQLKQMSDKLVVTEDRHPRECD